MIHFDKSTDVFKKLYSLDRFEEMKGSLSEKEARHTLVDFLRYNLGFTVELLFGIKIFPYQEIILKNWFENNFCMNVWSRGGSKTIEVSDNQLLIDKNLGMTSSAQLFKDIDFSKERWINIPNLNFWNGHDYTSVNKVLIQPQKPCIKITTHNGYDITGSENHLIKCLETKNNNCSIVWKRSHELTTEDYICIDRHNNMNFHQETIDKDEAYLIGLILGDGCISKSLSGGCFTSIDEELLNFVVDKTNGKIINKQKTDAKQVNFNKKYTDHLLEKYNINRTLSYDKKIPFSILSDKDAVKECLSGLFDTDGCVISAKLQVEFASVSIVLTKQIQKCLLLFGIISQFKEYKTKSKFGKIYKIIIRGENAAKFYYSVGFKLSRKQNKLKSILNKKYNSNIDIIPGLISCANDIKKKLKVKRGHSQWRQLRGLQHNRKNTTYKQLDLYIKCFEQMGCQDNRITKLKEIQFEHFFFDKIISLDKYTADCVDFNIPNGERYWCNGFINHNSFLAAIFVLLYPVFYPGTRVVLSSNVFRSSRRILETAEKLLNAKGAELIKQCYPLDIKRATDLWSLDCGDGGFIRALPLNERIRGERADILIVDEFLLVPEATYSNILLPFLNARNDIQEQLKIQEEEKRLIELGYLTEDQQTILESNKKVIALTSASYDFEYCYEVYKDWIAKATGASDAKNSKYFVSRLSYLALPIELLEEKVVDEAKSGGENSPYFRREYMAIFHKGSDGFFSMKHMSECTVPDGELPCVQAFGDKNEEYILSIDPSFSSGKNSDYFAMAVFLVDKIDKKITLVNSYAIPGGQLKDHVAYLYHIITNFNIVMIAGDFLGGVEGNFNFIEAANQSELFKNAGINLKSFEGELHHDGEDYIEAMQAMRKTYNKTAQAICFRQKYTPQWIKRSNEYMQYQIQAKKIWFASRIVPNEDAFRAAEKRKMSVKVYNDEGKELSMGDYLDEQDNLIQQTKNQIALIEPKVSAQGNLSFDLPASIKAIKGEKRARRDSYTVTLMACWAAKIYFDFLDDNIGKRSSFKPFFLN